VLNKTKTLQSSKRVYFKEEGEREKEEEQKYEV
jgi:hypothetical protein